MNKLTSLLLAAAFLLPTSVMANTITVTQSITASNTVGSVSYTYFSLDIVKPEQKKAKVTLTTFTDYFDAVLILLRDDGTLNSNDLKVGSLATGTDTNSLSKSLREGNYVLAVGDNSLSLYEAIHGINNSAYEGDLYGSYELTISTKRAKKASVALPEPASIALLGFALLGFGASRRRAK